LVQTKIATYLLVKKCQLRKLFIHWFRFLLNNLHRFWSERIRLLRNQDLCLFGWLWDCFYRCLGNYSLNFMCFFSILSWNGISLFYKLFEFKFFVFFLFDFLCYEIDNFC
jgi:hypothetical protein